MDKNQARVAIGAQIKVLAAERDATQDEDEKAAAIEAITKLQSARRRINVAANDAIGAQVDRLVGELEAVQNSHALDAGSALGRSIRRIRTLLDGPAGGGAGAGG